MHAVWATGSDIDIDPLINEPSRAGYTILYRRGDGASGEWGQPLVLARGQHAKLVLAPDGVPVFAWENDGFVSVARLSAPSGITVQSLAASASFPSLAAAANGILFVSWQERSGEEAPQIRFGQVRVREP